MQGESQEAGDHADDYFGDPSWSCRNAARVSGWGNVAVPIGVLLLWPLESPCAALRGPGTLRAGPPHVRGKGGAEGRRLGCGRSQSQRRPGAWRKTPTTA